MSSLLVGLMTRSGYLPDLVPAEVPVISWTRSRFGFVLAALRRAVAFIPGRARKTSLAVATPDFPTLSGLVDICGPNHIDDAEDDEYQYQP